MSSSRNGEAAGSGNKKDKAESLEPAKWAPLLPWSNFQRGLQENWPLQKKKLWDELASRLLKQIKSRDRGFDIPVRDIPIAPLKETRFYKALLEVCRAIKSCDDELKLSVSHKTDLVNELLQYLN